MNRWPATRRRRAPSGSALVAVLIIAACGGSPTLTPPGGTPSLVPSPAPTTTAGAPSASPGPSARSPGQPTPTPSPVALDGVGPLVIARDEADDRSLWVSNPGAPASRRRVALPTGSWLPTAVSQRGHLAATALAGPPVLLVGTLDGALLSGPVRHALPARWVAGGERPVWPSCVSSAGDTVLADGVGSLHLVRADGTTGELVTDGAFGSCAWLDARRFVYELDLSHRLAVWSTTGSPTISSIVGNGPSVGGGYLATVTGAPPIQAVEIRGATSVTGSAASAASPLVARIELESGTTINRALLSGDGRWLAIWGSDGGGAWIALYRQLSGTFVAAGRVGLAAGELPLAILPGA